MGYIGERRVQFPEPRRIREPAAIGEVSQVKERQLSISADVCQILVAWLRRRVLKLSCSPYSTVDNGENPRGSTGLEYSIARIDDLYNMC